MSDQYDIIFFDGKCNLCNSFIDFVIRRDKKKKFKVASLQGKTAKEKLSNQFTENLSTVVLYKENDLYIKSSAVIRILASLNYFFYPLYLFLIIPLFIRDPLYRLIAKYRYRFFGKRESCRLPTPEEKEYFLP